MDRSGTDTYPNHIRARREAAGLSQQDLAERSGITLAQILRLETQVPRPNATVRKKLAVVLGCAPDDLIHNDAHDDLPNRVRAMREAAGIGRNELATRTGLHPSEISTLELSRTYPPRFILEAVSRALNCHPDDLIRHRNNNASDTGTGRHLMNRIDDVFLDGNRFGARPAPTTLSIEARRDLRGEFLALFEEVRALTDPGQVEGHPLPPYPNKLAMIRKLAGLSQTELARGLGATQGAISQIERGRKRLMPSTAKRLAAILGCAIDDLYYRPTS